MTKLLAMAVELAEGGKLPDYLARLGIRALLRARLSELRREAMERSDAALLFQKEMNTAELALVPEKANEQHYELPARFFETVLGPHRKYSSAFWSSETASLMDAEEDALALTCQRALIADGQRVLELGCGWGSLTLWLAARYPRSTVTALSNSHTQRAFIEAEAERRGLANVRVITCDINHFDTSDRFDRIVSVEMFEHLRNWPRAFSKVANWLQPGGKFFLHVFAHRSTPYAFVERDASDWMSRHFFSGGMMPSDDLALHCQADLRLERRWRWDGTHYQRTAEEWLRRMDAHRSDLEPLFLSIYGGAADVWWMRWRLFFMAVAELFGFDGGRQWGVSHYLFARRA